jgi:hypothetical protein
MGLTMKEKKSLARQIRSRYGKLPAPLMRQQMPFIALWPAFGITADIREKLMKISPATIDRALKKDKAALALKGKSLTKPGDLLKHRIPIRTFYTNKAHIWTFQALKDIHSGLPFPLREFHSDNGSEFTSHDVSDWQRNPSCPVPFTRSRDRKKKR